MTMLSLSLCRHTCMAIGLVLACVLVIVPYCSAVDANITGWDDISFVPWNKTIYGDWSNLWWSWAAKQPVNETTLLPLIFSQSGEVDCNAGFYEPQSNRTVDNTTESWFHNLAGENTKVLFLAGIFILPDGVSTVQRHCMAPIDTSTSILVPLANSEFDTVWQNSSDSIQSLPDLTAGECIRDLPNNGTMFVEISSSNHDHGMPRNVSNLADGWVTSNNAIILDLDHNIGTWTPGRYIMQSVGYYLWIKPLPVGNYTIRSHSWTEPGRQVCNLDWHLDVTYHIQVQ